jgi:hypothetical protein
VLSLMRFSHTCAMARNSRSDEASEGREALSTAGLETGATIPGAGATIRGKGAAMGGDLREMR